MRWDADGTGGGGAVDAQAGVPMNVTAALQTDHMVLVAPQQSTNGEGDNDMQGVGGRDEVLTLLRDGSGQRPRFDPGLAGGLRAWLEDGASVLVAARGEAAPPLMLGPRALFGEVWPTESGPGSAVAQTFPPELLLACLVRALFRQIVMIGRVGDPLTDALDALGVEPARKAILQQVATMPEPERDALAASLGEHVGHLVNLVPRFASSWLPRTDDRIAIPLAGGRVVLTGVFDLLIGAPTPDTASLCGIGLTTGGRWAQARTSLHYLALLETLRNGTPPFRLALLHSADGRYGVENVCEAHLAAIVTHAVARMTALAATQEPDGTRD